MTKDLAGASGGLFQQVDSRGASEATKPENTLGKHWRGERVVWSLRLYSTYHAYDVICERTNGKEDKDLVDRCEFLSKK